MHKILTDEFGELPTTGVLAGQAVAEAYFIATGLDIKSRMKDLDWFVERDHDEIEKPRHMSSGAPRLNVDLVVPSHDADLRVGQFVKLGLYSIVTSDVINGGRINRVAIRDPEGFSHVATKTILEGFDINCAACALDLATKTVVKHEKFDAFCDTKQLDLISLHTPLSSLVRIVEKQKYIAGSTINMPEILNITGSAIWARYSSEYISFEEMLVKAPKVYQKGTGMTLGRYDDLIDEAKVMLTENFVKQSVALFNGDELCVFLPKHEPRRMITISSLEQVDVAMLSYSLDFVRKVNQLSHDDFFAQMIYPLKNMANTLAFSARFASLEACMKAIILRSFYEVDDTFTAQGNYAALGFEQAISLMSVTSFFCEDQKLLLGTMLTDAYYAYFYKTQATKFVNDEATFLKVNLILSDARKWHKHPEYFTAYSNMSFNLKRYVADTISKEISETTSALDIMRGVLHDKLTPMLDMSGIEFCFDEALARLTQTQYSMYLPLSFDGVMNSQWYEVSKHLNGFDTTYMVFEVEYKGKAIGFIGELVWSERDSMWRVKYSYENDNSENSAEMAEVVNAVAMHATEQINIKTLYSWKRLKSLIPTLRSSMSRYWREITESVTRGKELESVSQRVKYGVNNASKSGGQQYGSDIPF